MSKQLNRVQRNQNPRNLPVAPAKRSSTVPVDPVQFLQENPKPPRTEFIKLGAVTIIGLFCAVEFFQPFGFSPMTALGVGYGNLREPIRGAELKAQLCFDEQQRLAQRLSEAERDFADAMGQCTLVGTLGGVLDPNLAREGMAVCQNAVEQRFGTELKQLRAARERARECQL